jgi:hypothetical protein
MFGAWYVVPYVRLLNLTNVCRFLQFNNMYHDPGRYLNGTAPANVIGFIKQCSVNGTNCMLASSPDSYLWYDELHPSEQASRVVASEFVKVVGGDSQYATYWL